MSLFNTLFKSDCILCHKPSNASYLALCSRCFDNIGILSPSSSCSHCHKPLNSPNLINNICEECQKYRTNDAITRNYSAAIYDGNIKLLLFKLKFEKKKDVAKVLALIIDKYLKQNKLKLACDYLVPVPISDKRLSERGYNQALLIANELGRLSGFRINNSLIRHKSTEHLHSQTLSERKAVLSEAFSINESVNIKNKNIVILDDIFTTGTTVNECARILLASGAKSVSSLTAARTVF